MKGNGDGDSLRRYPIENTVVDERKKARKKASCRYFDFSISENATNA